MPELKYLPNSFIHEPWLLEKFNTEIYRNCDYVKPIIDIRETTIKAKKKIQEITKDEGYWAISKEIYLKHGSRKINSKNKRTISNSKNTKEKGIQYELKLKL